MWEADSGKQGGITLCSRRKERGQVMSLWLVMSGEELEEVPCDCF